MKTIMVNEDVGAHIIKSSFNKDALNKDHIVDLIFKSLDEHAITTLLGLLTSKEEPFLPKIGDIVYFRQDKYDKEIEYDEDILIDHRVFTGKKCHLTGFPIFYGIITGDASYGDSINSWYYKFNVSVISNDSSGNIELTKTTVKWEDLQYDRVHDDVKLNVKKVYEAHIKKSPELPF